MGQARMRGSREQRVALAVHRQRDLQVAREAAAAKREADERARMAALPPKVRKRVAEQRHRNRMRIAALLGLAYGLFGGAKRPMRLRKP